MGFNDIVSWAMKVQERLDASGYIFGFENKSLSFKDRVLINANVYDALLQEKAYRKAYSKEEANKNNEKRNPQNLIFLSQMT